MKTLGNLIWVIFGGIFIAIEYLMASLLLCLTIVGIPFGIQTLKLAMLALWPFATQVTHTPRQSGCLHLIMNVIWILIGGFWIWLSHFLFGILFAITIIGIPFARQHFKLAAIAFTPFGKELRQNP